MTVDVLKNTLNLISDDCKDSVVLQVCINNGYYIEVPLDCVGFGKHTIILKSFSK